MLIIIMIKHSITLNLIIIIIKSIIITSITTITMSSGRVPTCRSGQPRGHAPCGGRARSAQDDKHINMHKHTTMSNTATNFVHTIIIIIIILIQLLIQTTNTTTNSNFKPQ